MNPPYITPGFLTGGECIDIITLIQEYERTSSGTAATRRTPLRTEITARFLYQDEHGREAAFMDSVRARCSTAVNTLFRSRDTLYPEFTLLQANRPSDGHCRHADNSKYDAATSRWIPNHTPQRVVSVCIYLNRSKYDFLGGDLVFPTLPLTISPDAGLFVAFPSNESYEHEVSTIRSGIRYSILMWFTADRRCAEDQLIPSVLASHESK